MPEPYGFTWVKKPLLAAMAQPSCSEDLGWLREEGIDVLLSLTEEPPPRYWINEAGLMAFHEPIDDMTAPTLEQLQRCLSVLERAHAQNMGVAVHCAAGKGRTGTILAAWYIAQGESATQAIATVRALRPGSIETPEQETMLHRSETDLREKPSENATDQ